MEHVGHADYQSTLRPSFVAWASRPWVAVLRNLGRYAGQESNERRSPTKCAVATETSFAGQSRGVPRTWARRPCHRRLRSLTFALFAAALCLARLASADVAIADVDVPDDQQAPKPGGFSIKKEDPKVIEQIEDFERFRDKKAWDRAFKSLSAVLELPPSGSLAPAKDGFWIPTRQRLMQTLVTLPPEGREAYKLFNDAKAKQLYDQALAHETTGDADAVPLLKKVVEQFSITSVGDKAADRLGDALMEAGDYAGAAQAYESIALARPDTELPALRLLAKRATALARAGRAEQFKQLAAQLREQHAGETVKVGGKDLPVEAFLTSLLPPTTRPTTAATTAPPDTRIALPATTHPAWRHVFLDDALRDKINAQLNTNGWMGQQIGGMLTFAPACATDGKRIYLNWYGTVWALDAQTGKVVWWSGHFAPLAEHVNEMAQWQVEQRRFAVTVVGDNILTVALRLDKLNQQEPFRLSCLEGATGKKKWSSEAGALQNWAFIGEPMVHEGTVYAAVHPRNAQDIHLLAIDLSNGALRWESPLGQPAVGNNWRGMPVYPLPVLKIVGGTMYVMTNNGAVLAFDLASRAVVWAYSYDYAAPGPNENGMPTTTGDVPGSAFVREGVIYFKDQAGSAVYALDLAGPKLLFRRPVDEDQLFANLDDAGLYLVGPTFSFINAKERELLWAPSIPVTGGSATPVHAGDDYFVFTSRGIYKVNPTARSIDIFRGADPEAGGGHLLRAGDKLITVSNLSVTAYDVAPAR